MFDQRYGDEVDNQFQTQTGTYGISGGTLTLNLPNLQNGTMNFTQNGTYVPPPWKWSCYDDSYNNGTSTITMTPSSGIITESEAITFAGTVNPNPNGQGNGYVGIRVTPNAAVLANLKTAVSIQFDIYGDGKTYRMRLPTSDLEDAEDWNFYETDVTTTQNAWKNVTVNVNSLARPQWAEDKPFNQNLVLRIEWQPDYSLTGGFSFQIKNLTLTAP